MYFFYLLYNCCDRKLSEDMQATREALDNEHKMQLLQMQAINALWKKVSLFYYSLFIIAISKLCIFFIYIESISTPRFKLYQDNTSKFLFAVPLNWTCHFLLVRLELWHLERSVFGVTHQYDVDGVLHSLWPP